MFDRKKDMINRGGYKIYSVEVENVLMGHPDVVEAAVIAKPCPVLGERAHAVVCAKSAAGHRREIWRAIAHACSPTTRCRTASAFAPTPLPRNANGKVMKRELRQELPGA